MAKQLGFLVLAGLLAVGAAGTVGAQAPGAQGSNAPSPVPGGPLNRGFSSQILIMQLSLYLPEEATRGMNRGFAGRGGGADGAGGQNTGGQNTGGQNTGGRFAPMQIPRDPKLFLTKEQITQLLPILIALRDNPLPSPARAKQVQGQVDSLLTAGQKAEWADFQKKLQELIGQFQSRMGSNGSAGQGAARNDGSPGEGAPGAGSRETLLQRRQRQLDAFIEIARNRLNLAGA